jgi:type I restriction enzyme S subunit
MPKVEEQRQIISYIDQKNEKVDSLLKKSSMAVSLLQERRTALISAAVTGKIDVRNWQPPTDKAIQ